MGKRYLHHYTSTDGFYHIVKDHTIRMTSAEFMNDPSDCSYFLSVAESYIYEDERCRNAFDCFEEKYQKNYACSYRVMDFLKYVLHRISLCAMSFSDEVDSMKMWNNYGRGGMEMVFDLDLLIDALRSSMYEGEYLICSKVTYFPYMKQNLDKIGICNLSETRKRFIRSCDTEIDRKEKVPHTGRAKEIHNRIMGIDEDPYYVDNVGGIIRYFVTSYLYSLELIIADASLDNMSKEEVYNAIFSSMTDHEQGDDMVWRKDILLNMIAWSASIKVDSYRFEKETRIVYFDLGSEEINPDLKNNRKDCYIRTLEAGEIICPCVNFHADLLGPSLANIVISPLTLNIPIDSERYAECLKSYLCQIGYEEVKVSFSANEVRWV